MVLRMGDAISVSYIKDARVAYDSGEFLKLSKRPSPFDEGDFIITVVIRKANGVEKEITNVGCIDNISAKESWSTGGLWDISVSFDITSLDI